MYSIGFTSYGIKSGAWETAVIAENPSDTVLVTAHKAGDVFYFDAEAYHLKQWCAENGLEYSENRHWVLHNFTTGE